MQLGFVSAILPDLSLEEVLTFAAETGYDCVEVMCWPPGGAERRYAGVTHIDVEQLGDARLAAIGKLIDDTGVRISGLGYYPNPLAADESERSLASQHLRRVIDGAAALGIGCVTSFIGRDPGLSVDANWPRFEEVWGPLLEHAAERQVKIAIENCPMLFTGDEWPGGKNLAASPAVWRRMFATFPAAHFGLNFDPSHFIWQQMDYLAAIREFADRIHHAHAKDVRLDRHRLAEVGILATPLEYHTPKLPGLGEVDWGAYFSLLTDVGYRGPVCVEVEDRAYESSREDRLASLRQSLTFLRNYVPRR